MLVDAFFNRLREPASRLRQALDDGNSNQARIESHSMKGMCASLGAQRCAEIYAANEECNDYGRLDGHAPLLDPGEQEMLLVERALVPAMSATAFGVFCFLGFLVPAFVIAWLDRPQRKP